MQRTTSLPRFFSRLVRFAPWAYAGASVGAILFFLIGRIVPGLVLQRIFDDLSGAAPAELSIVTLLVLYVSAEVVRRLSHFLSGFPRATYFETARMLLTKNTLRLLLEKPGAAPLPVAPGDAVNRLDDDVAEPSHFPLWLPSVVGHGLAFLVAFVIMLRIEAQITLVVVLPLLAVVALTNVLRDRMLRFYAASRAAESDTTAFLGELFAAVQAVKIAGAEEDVINRLARLNERRRQAGLRQRLLDDLLRWVGRNLSDVAIGIVLLLGAGAIRAGTFTVGDFSLFVTYLASIVDFPGEVGGFMADYRTQEVSVNRLLELTEQSDPAVLVQPTPIYRQGPLPDVGAPARREAHRLRSLQVRNLTYRHAQNGQGIEGVSLGLAPGTLTVITGRVGSGKSTLLRVLLGLLPRDEGSILWNGNEVHDPASFFVPPRCAYTPQVPRLFSMPLRDNVLLGLPLDEADLREALSAAILDQDLRQLEKGLDTVVGPRGVRLSGGQVQRTAAARMFVRQPALLVFDDLSSALDVETEAGLWEGLLARTGRPSDEANPTILAVSHRRAALQRADQVIVMAGGRVESVGPLSALLQESDEMQRIWKRGVQVED